MARDDETPTILVVKKRTPAPPPSGAGAWKVAYADFVTAMMAFFLLLWLLNVTTDDQKKGIAEYFAPENVSRSTSGIGSILAGKSLESAALPRGGGGIVLGVPVSPAGSPSNEEAPDTTDPPKEVDDPVVGAVNAGPGSHGEGSGGEASDRELHQALADKQETEFAAAEQALNAAFDSVPELKPLRANLLIDRADEGLRIQIVDQDPAPMFPVGSPQPNQAMQRLVGLVAAVVGRLSNQIAITGHTDSLPYPEGAAYTNWELSIDRANACRRALIAAGLAPQRIYSVMGKADSEPLTADAADPRNRRISLVLLRDHTLPGASKVAHSLMRPDR